MYLTRKCMYVYTLPFHSNSIREVGISAELCILEGITIFQNTQQVNNNKCYLNMLCSLKRQDA